MKRLNTILNLGLCLSLVLAIGCKPKTDTVPLSGSGTTDAGGGHVHAEHGPNGGHIIVLDPGHVHAEWTHDDAKLITVYLDELAAAPSEVKFVVKAGDAEPQSFPLTKSTSTEPAQAAAWTTAGDALLTHVNMGEAAKVSLVVVTADGQLTAPIEHSDEHDHKH